MFSVRPLTHARNITAPNSLSYSSFNRSILRQYGELTICSVLHLYHLCRMLHWGRGEWGLKVKLPMSPLRVCCCADLAHLSPFFTLLLGFYFSVDTNAFFWLFKNLPGWPGAFYFSPASCRNDASDLLCHLAIKVPCLFFFIWQVIHFFKTKWTQSYH